MSEESILYIRRIRITPLVNQTILRPFYTEHKGSMQK